MWSLEWPPLSLGMLSLEKENSAPNGYSTQVSRTAELYAIERLKECGMALKTRNPTRRRLVLHNEGRMS